MGDQAEFEIRVDGMFVASVEGPRDEALREAMHYVTQYRSEGEVVVYEVTRRILEI